MVNASPPNSRSTVDEHCRGWWESLSLLSRCSEPREKRGEPLAPGDYRRDTGYPTPGMSTLACRPLASLGGCQGVQPHPLPESENGSPPPIGRLIRWRLRALPKVAPALALRRALIESAAYDTGRRTAHRAVPHSGPIEVCGPSRWPGRSARPAGWSFGGRIPEDPCQYFGLQRCHGHSAIPRKYGSRHSDPRPTLPVPRRTASNRRPAA